MSTLPKLQIKHLPFLFFFLPRQNKNVAVYELPWQCLNAGSGTRARPMRAFLICLHRTREMRMKKKKKKIQKAMLFFFLCVEQIHGWMYTTHFVFLPLFFSSLLKAERNPRQNGATSADLFSFCFLFFCFFFRAHLRPHGTRSSEAYRARFFLLLIGDPYRAPVVVSYTYKTHTQEAKALR